MRKQYEIVAIYLFLFANFVSWDNWTKFLGGKFDPFSTLKMLHWFKSEFGIWKSFGIWSSKIWLFELFNCLIWCDSKNVELKLKFGLDILNKFLNLVIWIDFVKRNLIEKSHFGIKTHLLKHYLAYREIG